MYLLNHQCVSEQVCDIAEFERAEPELWVKE